MRDQIRNALANAETERDMRQACEKYGLPKVDADMVIFKHRELTAQKNFTLLIQAGRLAMSTFRPLEGEWPDDLDEQDVTFKRILRQSAADYVRLILATYFSIFNQHLPEIDTVLKHRDDLEA